MVSGLYLYANFHTTYKEKRRWEQNPGLTHELAGFYYWVIEILRVSGK